MLAINTRCDRLSKLNFHFRVDIVAVVYWEAYVASKKSLHMVIHGH